MFQNKRRRYSHESRGHTVRRRPLPDIGAVQDPGRCQVDLLLDARPPRGRTRRPPMRVTRSACGATAARSMGQEDQARPGACGHRHVAPPRQPDHEGRGHGGLVFEGPVPAASGQAERRSGPEHPRPRIRWLRPRTRTSPPTRPTWGGRQFMGVHMPARRAREPRDRGPRRRDAARRGSRAGRVRHAALPVRRHRGVPHRPGRRVHRGTHRTNARRVRHHAFPVESRQPLRRRGGRIHQPSHQKELVYANTYTSVEQLRSDANRYVWWYNHQRLHSTLGYMSPVEFTQQGVFSQVGVSCFVTDFFHCGKTLPNPPNKH